MSAATTAVEIMVQDKHSTFKHKFTLLHETLLEKLDYETKRIRSQLWRELIIDNINAYAKAIDDAKKVLRIMLVENQIASQKEKIISDQRANLTSDDLLVWFELARHSVFISTFSAKLLKDLKELNEMRLNLAF